MFNIVLDSNSAKSKICHNGKEIKHLTLECKIIQ